MPDGSKPRSLFRSAWLAQEAIVPFADEGGEFLLKAPQFYLGEVKQLLSLRENLSRLQRPHKIREANKRRVDNGFLEVWIVQV